MLGVVGDFINWVDYPAWVWLLIAIYLALPAVVYIAVPYLVGNVSVHPRVVICVLGDLGHSPRMCYHARSFALKGYAVDLCGYLESSPPQDIVDNEDIDIHQIKTVSRGVGENYFIFIVKKVVGQLCGIASLLWELRGAKYIMVQNPPGIPVLLLAVVYKYITGAKLIIDWHNLGYSILAIKLGPSHLLVTLNRIYEKLLSRFADINLTVTKKMKDFLKKEFGVKSKKITILYDKAAADFKPLTEAQKTNVIQKYKNVLFNSFDSTRDKILVSSTSFTPDEDFNVLLEAMKKYEKHSGVPNLRVIITGKGPMKDEFLYAVKEAGLTKVTFRTAWLPIEDYPLVLGTADIGVSLHTSSSGIDLPMKVVDMFGCGVPVLALDFPALPELVESGVNGYPVQDSNEILERLLQLFGNDEKYRSIKSGAMEKSKERWELNWRDNFGDKRLLP